MKKSLFLAALVLMSAGCFAQKANVKKAKNLAQQETPDFDGARAAIKPALENDETKDLAETWYVAGLIGYQQADAAFYNQTITGQLPDESVLGPALAETFQYWLKADEIACRQLIDKKGNPMFDKKGNPVIDTKMRQNLAKKMQTLYERQEYVKYGSAMNDVRDFEAAYEAFDMHLRIPNLDMMDEKARLKMPKDSIYEQYAYYKALFAVQSEMHEKAIAALLDIKDNEYEQETVWKFLYQEYLSLQDTVNYVEVLKESINRFPQEPWFLQNLINHYIYSNQEAEAVNYLMQAVEREPNVAQYHLILGNLYVQQEKWDEAVAAYDRCLELDPTIDDAYAGKGRRYYNQAVNMFNAADEITDVKKSNKAKDEANKVFRQAMPLFEEAHRLNPTNRDHIINLRTLYYRFRMEKEYEQLSEELKNL